MEGSVEANPPGTVYMAVRGTSTVTYSPQPSRDPNEPLNWSTRRKVGHVMLLLLYAFFIFASNTASTPLYSYMSKDLGYSEFVLDISFAANAAALGIGSLIFVPFACLLGRRSIYIVTSLLMFGCDIWAARSQTEGDIIGSSIVQGIAGSVNEAMFQMTVVDLFFVHQRGTVNGCYLISSAAGNFIAPIASGYIARAEGWRWSLWVVAIFMGAVSLLLILFLEETKFDGDADADNRGSRSHDQDAEELDRSSSQRSWIDKSIPKASVWRRLRLLSLSPHNDFKTFLTQFYRPFVILVSFPGIFCGAFVYGFYVASINILAVTQTVIYPEAPYHFSSIGVGNLNIAPAVGAAIGSGYGGVLADRAILIFAKWNGNIYEPEMRLWLFSVPALSMSIGTLLYGLSSSKGLPWYIGSVGGGFMGFGLGGGGDLMITYVQDSYSKIIGPAFIGAVFVVNILSFILILLLTPWQAGMGTYNMFVLLGCISIAVNLIVVPLIIWGKRWRRMTAAKYQRIAEKLSGKQQ